MKLAKVDNDAAVAHAATLEWLAGLNENACLAAMRAAPYGNVNYWLDELELYLHQRPEIARLASLDEDEFARALRVSYEPERHAGLLNQVEGFIMVRDA